MSLSVATLWLPSRKHNPNVFSGFRYCFLFAPLLSFCILFFFNNCANLEHLDSQLCVAHSCLWCLWWWWWWYCFRYKCLSEPGSWSKEWLGKIQDSRKSRYCFDLENIFGLKESHFINLKIFYDLNKTRWHLSYSDWTVTSGLYILCPPSLQCLDLQY